MTAVDRVFERARRLPPIVINGALGVAIFVANVVPNPFAMPTSFLLANAAAAVSVAIRRTNLFVACGLWTVLGIVAVIMNSPWSDPTQAGQGLYLTGLVLLYSVAERAPTLLARLALPGSIVAGFVLAHGQLRRLDVVYYTFVLVPWISVAWYGGRAQARRRAIAADLERSADELRTERELLVQGAVAAERARIARDLHALVLRGVKRMNAEANAARRLLGQDPARAAGPIGEVESGGRDTLVEMRRLLSVLRASDHADDGSTGASSARILRNTTPSPEGDRHEALPEHAPQGMASRFGGWAKRWMPTPWGADALPVIALAVMGLAEHVFLSRVQDDNGVILGCCHTVHATLWIAAMVALLLWRRIAPLVVLGLMAVLNFIPYEVAHVGGVAWTGDMAVAVAAYSVGALRGRRSGIIAIAVVAFSYSAVGGHVHFDWWMLSWAVNLGLPVVAGLAVGASRALGAQLADQTEVLRRTREERVRLAVVEERSRIARDVHDMVAHGVTLMVIQAGAARWLVESDPAKADLAMNSVQLAGQQALRELEGLVGELGSTSGDVGEALPFDHQLSIRSLVERENETGLSVELIVRGQPNALDPGLQLSLYRIVQEALTNIHKHAPGATAWVRLRYEPRGIEVEVRDVGGASEDEPQSVPGAGHGLVGIAERAAFFGGRAEFGPTPEGGFRVNAYLGQEAALV